MNIELRPLKGMIIDNKAILFGDGVEEVKNKLGEPETEYHDMPYSAPVELYYFRSELRFDFRDNKLEYIECLSGYEGEIQPLIYGIKPFRVKADELLKILTDENNGDIDDSENGISYAFLNSCIGIYREYLPEDIEGPEDDDILKADYWCTIGIGCKGYYDTIRQLQFD